MSVGMATSAVSKIWEFVGPTILRQGGYILFCKIYAKDLKLQVKKLEDASARIRHSVDEAESVGDVIEDDVWTWLNKSDQLIESGNMILRENNIVSCCFHLVPDPKSCYTLGRAAKKFLPNLEAHSSEGKFDKVSYHPVAESVEEAKVRSATSSSTVRYVELKSRALALKNIMAALDVDNTKVIGVCGMGGVGKTTLLKEVESRAKESGKFDDVVSAFVSQNPDTKGIRIKIVNRLGRLGSKEDEATKKTILILLDDLWTKLNLKDVGVPESNNKVRVKLVMTSRKQDLLANEMNCHPTFSLGVLDEEEGWRFFSELVSGKVEDLKRNHAAVELLKKCAGLPVSVEALATVWKKKTKDSSSSSDLLISVDELKYGTESLDGSVSLELSYNSLGDSDEDKQAKLLFRIIGLLGTPRVPILTLLKYSVGLGLFGSSTNVGNIMDRARREVTRSIRTLQDSSLLLESDDSNHVKIHDVVRDVAARIASRDDHALIYSPHDGVKGWSRAKMKESTAVSLPYSAIPEIYEGWNFQDLNIFIMEAGSEQGDAVELPNSYFKGMVKVKVIHLKNARFMSLPSSIQSGPHHLTTLCLHYCYLENVAAIGKLKSLQVLSFVGSDITQLPKEIGGLTNLRMLDLSKCSKLESIKPGVLERLTRLEELYLKQSFNRWEIEGDGQNGNSGLAELNNLQRLSTLEVHVPETNALPPKLSLGDLVQYKILMGDAWDWSGEYRESRTLKLKVKADNMLTEEWLQSALQKTQDLHLDGLNGSSWESLHLVCRVGFKELKHLHLQNSSSLQYVIWSTEWLAGSAFTILESMILQKMESLEKICHGITSPTSFSKLKVIKVQECHKLRNLFNLSLVKSLTELEEIEISYCQMVREIVIAEQMDDDGGTDEDHKVTNKSCSDNLFFCPIKRSGVSKTKADAAEEGMTGMDSEIKLGNLRYLTLSRLPTMTAFLTKEAPSESMAFFNDQQVSLHNSKPLKPRARLALGLGNLRRVEVEDCKGIVNFINSGVLLKLVNLESITIARCDSLEVIFDLEGLDAKSGNIEILPKLYELKLSRLPKLVHIWKKNSKQIKGCRKLRTLEIHQCDILPYVSSSTMCESMENLTEINIVNCDKMKKIFMEEDGRANDGTSMMRLTSLKILWISKCQKLKEFLSCPNIDDSTAFKCSNQGTTYWCCKKQDLILADTSSTFFNRKVFLPSLQTLLLSSSGGFEKLWSDEVPDKSYCNLEFVDVKGCQNLSTVIPATLLERLQNLKQLRVKECVKLETVFDLVIGWKTKRRPKALILSQLQEVKLSGLGKLRRIIQSETESEIVVSFPSLKELEVLSCSKLEYLIPTATATTLLKLEKLHIRACNELREVIHGEVSERNKRNVITFPHLTSLTMIYLDNLTYFSSVSYLLNFTCLKFLSVHSLELFKSFVKPRLDGQGSHDTSTRALFHDKVELPNLEELVIRRMEAEELWSNEPPPGSFCKLKLLKISGCRRLRSIVPSFMIKRLQNLEGMEISYCESLEDIFKTTSTQQIQLQPEERIVEVEKDNMQVNDIVLTKLTSLPSLKKLQVYDVAVGALEAIIRKVQLPNLEELQIGYIRDIKELWHSEPHVGSFCKLKKLLVKSCGLVMIFPSFMLKRLQNLEELVVESCDHLEIVSELGELPLFVFQNLTSIHVKECKCVKYLFSIPERHLEYGDDNGIVLPQLTNLTLEDLPQLIHLYQGQGHYTLKLLSLKEFFLIRSGDKEVIAEKVVFPEELEIRASANSFFGSTTTVLAEIMNALQSHQIIIGALGALGVPWVLGALGALRRLDNELKLKLERRVKEEAINLFDQVVETWGDADFIQNALGKELGIIYGGKGVQEKAQCLRKSLLSNRERRLLLILNGVDEEIDFKDIGIPCDDLDPRLFKLIVVSENKDLLVKMGVQKVISIGSGVAQRHYMIPMIDRVVAEELADECGSDDLARILAKKLKGQDLSVWKDALERLRGSAFEYAARERVILSLPEFDQH